MKPVLDDHNIFPEVLALFLSQKIPEKENTMWKTPVK